MTTAAAAKLYLAQHEHEMEGRGWAVFNPEDLVINDLPIIYGYNNGGCGGMLSAVLLAEDGTGLGGHCCSSEGYMPHDLGVLEGSRPDMHETFRSHYPRGYRLVFVPAAEVLAHDGLRLAHERNEGL